MYRCVCGQLHVWTGACMVNCAILRCMHPFPLPAIIEWHAEFEMVISHTIIAVDRD